MQPLILMENSLSNIKCGNSSSINDSSTMLRWVLLLMAKLQVSVPGHDVTSAPD